MCIRDSVDTISPIAYWTFKSSWLNRKSYLLYRKVESEHTVFELCKHFLQSSIQNKEILIETIANRCIDLVKNIHAANIRHDDPHGGNILTDINRSHIHRLRVDDIMKARLTLIDNDRCTLSRTANPIIKRFFDLKDLARFRICELPQQELLRMYLGKEYRTCWLYVPVSYTHSPSPRDS